MMTNLLPPAASRAPRARHRVLALIGAVAVLAAAACAGDAASDAAPQASAIAIRGFQFVPAIDTVQVGDTVVWTNEDMVPHTATTLADGVFDSGSLDQNGVWRWVAAAPGTHEYECTFHPNMRGTLVVQ